MNETAVLVKVAWEDVLMALTEADRERRTSLRSELHDLEARMPPPNPAAWTIKNGENVPETYVLKRGDPNRKLLSGEIGYSPGFDQGRRTTQIPCRIGQMDDVTGQSTSGPRYCE